MTCSQYVTVGSHFSRLGVPFIIYSDSNRGECFIPAQNLARVIHGGIAMSVVSAVSSLTTVLAIY